MSLEVAGGTYYRTYANDGGGPTGETDPATVSTFRIDKYEVTVGRFRQFVRAWSGGWTPEAGCGKHTHLNGGRGLQNGPSGPYGSWEPGWVTSDDDNVAPTDANLESCDASYGATFSPLSTWTPSPGSSENLPINCVNWFESYAFCIWDGGFLPSEAEWEYAAAGGSQQREYPWGSAEPGTNSQYAIWDCSPGGPGLNCLEQSLAPVGTATLGAGRWGQLDLAGNVEEFALDWYGTYIDPWANCASLLAALVRSDFPPWATLTRVSRGGSAYIYGATGSLFPSYRDYDSPAARDSDLGFRCARSP